MKSMTGFAHLSDFGTWHSGHNNAEIVQQSLFGYCGVPSAVRIRHRATCARFFGLSHCARQDRMHIQAQKVETSIEDIELHFQSAKMLSEQLRNLAEACRLEDRPSLDILTRFPGIVEMNMDIDEAGLWQILSPALEEAWREFEESRVREGLATEANIMSQLERLQAKLAEIEAQADILEQLIHDQIVGRFKELLVEQYDESRVLQEVAVQLVRLTINEEIERLKAHFEAFRLISAQPCCGKKLDFLCQEMNREVNTIGSKNMLVTISHAVVDMKDALENIREQLRNVE